MVHRGIAALSGLLMLCFLLFTNFEPEFFALHFYQSVVYLVILLMLFFLEDRWAYMFGIVAPAFWLFISYSTGLVIARLTSAPGPVRWLTGVVILLSLLMIAFNVRRWRREFTGMGQGWSTFLITFAILGAYYGILMYLYWEQLTHYRRVG